MPNGNVFGTWISYITQEVLNRFQFSRLGMLSFDVPYFVLFLCFACLSTKILIIQIYQVRIDSAIFKNLCSDEKMEICPVLSYVYLFQFYCKVLFFLPISKSLKIFIEITWNKKIYSSDFHEKKQLKYCLELLRVHLVWIVWILHVIQ